LSGWGGKEDGSWGRGGKGLGAAGGRRVFVFLDKSSAASRRKGGRNRSGLDAGGDDGWREGERRCKEGRRGRRNGRVGLEASSRLDGVDVQGRGLGELGRVVVGWSGGREFGLDSRVGVVGSEPTRDVGRRLISAVQLAAGRPSLPFLAHSQAVTTVPADVRELSREVLVVFVNLLFLDRAEALAQDGKRGLGREQFVSVG
jgi:hypothetical protein